MEQDTRLTFRNWLHFCINKLISENEYKIKMGVSSNIIDKYTVYSTETSNEMSKNISNYTNSNYGIGVTGKLNRVDKFNLYGEDNIVYISIYDRDNNNYYNEIVKAICDNREDNKKLVIDMVTNMLKKVV